MGFAAADYALVAVVILVALAFLTRRIWRRKGAGERLRLLSPDAAAVKPVRSRHSKRHLLRRGRPKPSGNLPASSCWTRWFDAGARRQSWRYSRPGKSLCRSSGGDEPASVLVLLGIHA